MKLRVGRRLGGLEVVALVTYVNIFILEAVELVVVVVVEFSTRCSAHGFRCETWVSLQEFMCAFFCRRVQGFGDCCNVRHVGGWRRVLYHGLHLYGIMGVNNENGLYDGFGSARVNHACVRA